MLMLQYQQSKGNKSRAKPRTDQGKEKKKGRVGKDERYELASSVACGRLRPKLECRW